MAGRRVDRDPVLPVARLEMELHTVLGAKHVMGSVGNLDALAAPLSVTFIGQGGATWRR